MESLPALPETPRVSIYMTAYNHERFVAEAVESVLAQRWPSDRLQFVVVDDGSSDDTWAALQPYRDHAQLIHQENRGLRGAVDRGMTALEGEVITSISGDDIWPEGRLRLLVDTLRAHPRAGLVYSDLEVIDAGGGTLAPSFMAASNLVPRSGDIRGPLLRANFVSGGGCMQRGCLKPHVHPIPAHACWEDWWWAWALSSVAEVAYVQAATCRYRMHGANLSLAAQGDALADAQRQELPFRRWMLAQAEHIDASADDVVHGLAMFDHVLATVARATGDDAAQLATVDDRQRDHAARQRRRADAALAADAPQAALLAAVAGLAADPFEAGLRERVGQLAPRLTTAAPSIDIRSFVVLADADELASEPQLLRAYARTFGAGDDVTLVVHGRGWSDERLVGLLGPALEGSEADVLALAAPAVERHLLYPRTGALLGTWCGRSDRPSFDADGVVELRALARRHSRPAVTPSAATAGR